MFKKELFSKVVKDYNNRLEEILEKKTFSFDAKNLLLSMLYKIENAYEDYSTVKRNVCKKKYFVEKILNIIEKRCREIELVKPMTPESKMLEEKNSLFKIEQGKIFCYQNEKAILDAILDMMKKDIYIGENHKILAVAIEKMLNIGTKINNAEVIRDFNGWTWDITDNEIENLEYNIIYQNLIILLGNEFMQEWVNDSIVEEIEEKRTKPINYILSGGPEKIEVDDFVSSKERENSMLHHMTKIEKILEKKYDIVLAKEVRINLEKVVIALGGALNEKEAEKIRTEKRKAEEALEELQDKVKYAEKQSKKKKELTEKIKTLDTIVNDKIALKKEYEKRNKELPNKEKIFSVNYYEMELDKQRQEALEEMQAINKKIEPLEFVRTKTEAEEKVKFYQSIVVKDKIEIEKNMIDLQKSFMQCYEKNIEMAETKKEITEYIYMLRYYLLLPIKQNKQVKDEVYLKKEIDKLEKMLIQKACKQNVLTVFSDKDEKLNTEILKNIFISKIINLEEIIFVLKYQEDILGIEICDENIHELTTQIKITQKTELSVKLNKKIKVWA